MKPMMAAYGGDLPQHGYGQWSGGTGYENWNAPASGSPSNTSGGPMSGGLSGFGNNTTGLGNNATAQNPGFFGGDNAYNSWQSMRGAASNINPWFGAFHQLGQMGEKAGLGEFFDPFGAQLQMLQKNPETGKRDWKGIGASLLGGPLGSFIHNKMNNNPAPNSTAGGGGGGGGGLGGLFGGGGGGGGGFGGLFGMEHGGDVLPYSQYANGGNLPQHKFGEGIRKAFGLMADPFGFVRKGGVVDPENQYDFWGNPNNQQSSGAAASPSGNQ